MRGVIPALERRSIRDWEVVVLMSLFCPAISASKKTSLGELLRLERS